MSKFYSHFDVARCKNADKIYDRHDNVNRVSYVNSTLLIKRFINEGKSLQAARAAALRSGMYSGDMNEILNDDGIVLPVYDEDPAAMQPIIESAKATLDSRIKAAQRKRSESSAIDSESTDDSQISSAVEQTSSSVAQ